MTYSTTITAASLRVRESRLLADLLLEGVDEEQWRERVVAQNLLQMKSEHSVRKVAGVLRARLEPMGSGLWRMVRDGDQVLATQACLAAAIKHSRLLGDFLDLVVRDQRATFATELPAYVWSGYIQSCRSRDPDMPMWSEQTVERLRSSVFNMLAEAGYLKDSRGGALQNVYVDDQLSEYLRNRGETYVLRCLEVAE